MFCLILRFLFIHTLLVCSIIICAERDDVTLILTLIIGVIHLSPHYFDYIIARHRGTQIH